MALEELLEVPGVLSFLGALGGVLVGSLVKIGISILTSLWDHELAKRHPNVYRKSCALLFCNQHLSFSW